MPMVKTIAIAEALLTDAVFIDTRTPKEFAIDHIPGAANLPILSNEQRHQVGITYKQVSQQKAIEQGIGFFSAKLPEFMKEVDKHRSKLIIFYCWRGGMRSKAVAALLEALGYNVQQLIGGYKSYRSYVIERLQNYSFKPKLLVLWGLTCSGKTELLNRFANSLDLEGLAQHRGSLYGAIGLAPNSQKRFETLLLQRLEQLQSEEIVIIEGESRKIGEAQIPGFLYQQMQNGINILVKKSLGLRAEFATKEYFSDQESILKIKEITSSLRRLISNQQRQELLQLLNQRQLKLAAKILIKNYYDPLYNHTLRQLKFAAEINNDNLAEAKAELSKIIQQIKANHSNSSSLP